VTLREDWGEEGLPVIEEALRLMASHFDCFWEAELHCLQGELLVQAGAEGTEACFQRARAIARQQGAKALSSWA
jgi:hypothetical protein